LQSQPEIYERLEKLGAQFRQGAAEIFAKAGIPASVQVMSSLGTVFFTKGGVKSYDDARKCDTKRFARYFNGLLERGVLIVPSQFEAMFFSAAHSKADVEYFLDSLNAVVAQKDF
jgi:glutamate-1-semialdehyde 2,1-aminomutase